MKTSGSVPLTFTQFIGYLSSCSGASVQVFAIEVDPCTGDEKLRQVNSLLRACMVRAF